MADAPVTKTRAADASVVGLLLLAAGLVVIGTHIVHPNFAKIAALLGGRWTPDMVASAWKWSRRRGVPFNWVLATIIVESGANQYSQGDAGGRSKGLMQVNTVAHAQELTAAGLRPEDMYNVDRGIEWGTKVMKDILADVNRAIGGRRIQTPLDVTMRLAYKGPATVTSTIKRGGEPAAISWAPEAIAHWTDATRRVGAATGMGVPVKLPFV